MALQWDRDQFGYRGKGGTWQGGPPHQGNTAQAGFLVAAAAETSLVEEVELSGLCYGGSGEQKR